MKDRVLLVDDEKNVLSSLRRQLRGKFDIATAVGGGEAISLIEAEEPFAVVVTDMRMPEMDGVTFLKKAKELSPETVRMMLTGNADQETAIQAVNEGDVFRFFNKPCAPEVLEAGINAALEQHRLITAERDLLQKTLSGSIKVLVDVVRLVDQDIFTNPDLLRSLARDVATELNVPNAWRIEMAATVAQIGRLTAPPDLMVKLRRTETLTETEQEIVDRCPETSRDLIGHIPRLEAIGEIAYYQNKNFDGSGFPDDDVRGEDIPAGARILHVLIDLLESSGGRAPGAEAMAALMKRPGRYDPKVLEAVAKLIAADLTSIQTPVDWVRTSVKVQMLADGDQLAEDIEADDGTVLLAAGQTVNRPQIKKLANLAKMKRVCEPVHVFRPVPDAEQIQATG